MFCGFSAIFINEEEVILLDFPCKVDAIFQEIINVKEVFFLSPMNYDSLKQFFY